MLCAGQIYIHVVCACVYLFVWKQRNREKRFEKSTSNWNAANVNKMWLYTQFVNFHNCWFIQVNSESRRRWVKLTKKFGASKVVVCLWFHSIPYLIRFKNCIWHNFNRKLDEWKLSNGKNVTKASNKLRNYRVELWLTPKLMNIHGRIQFGWMRQS